MKAARSGLAGDPDTIERGLSAAAKALEGRPGLDALCDWMWWVLADAYEGSLERGWLALENAPAKASALVVEATCALARVMAPPSRRPVLELSYQAMLRASDEVLRPATVLELVRLGLPSGENAARRAARIASRRSGQDAVENLVVAAALLPPSEASAWFDEALALAVALRPDELESIAERAFGALAAERAALLVRKIEDRGGAPREWRIALSPWLPDAALAGALAQVRTWAADCTVILKERTRSALLEAMDVTDCLAWLEEAWLNDALGLVDRLAALGARDQALAVFDRRFSEPKPQAEARLAAYRAGSRAPTAHDLVVVRDAVAGFDSAQWPELIKRHAPVLGVFFEEEYLAGRVAPLQDAMGIEARAALAPFVDAPLRRRLLREAVELQEPAGDQDTLVWLVRCAPWLEIEEVVSLIVLELPARDLEGLLREHGTLWWTAPLLHRLVEDEGMVEIARLLTEALLQSTG